MVAEQRTQQVNLAIMPALLERIEACASMDGMNRVEWMRRALLDAVERTELRADMMILRTARD